MKRRSLVRATAAGICGGLAGCLESIDTDGSPSSSDEGPDDAATTESGGSTDSNAGNASDPDATDDEADGSTATGRGVDWDAVDPDTWRSFQGSARNLGYAGQAALPDSEPTVRWTTTLEGAATGSPAIVDGTVFVADDAGTVTALDVESGDETWQTAVDGGRIQTPCVLDGLVIVGTKTNDLVALDVASGEREWTCELAGPVAGPSGADGTIYVGTDRGDGDESDEDDTWFVYAVDADTGSIDWETQVETPAVSYPAVTSDTVYVGLERTATLEGWLFSLDRDDGSITWGRRHTRMQPPVALENEVLAPGLDVSVRSSSGLKRGQFSPSGHVLWPPVATPDAFVTIGTGGILVANPRFRPGDGPQWFHDVGGRPVTGPVATDDLVLVVGPEAELVACDYETGDEAWTYALEGDFVSTPAVAADAVFVGDDTGTVYALE